jgi:hypothetical protein
MLRWQICTGGTVKRPLGVTLVALFEFFKASFLLLVAATIWLHPGTKLASAIVVRHLIWFKEDPKEPYQPIVLAVVAVAAAVTGCGLLRLKQWARAIAVMTSFLTLYGWIWPLDGGGHAWPRSALGRQALPFLMFLDAAVIFYLVLGDVGSAFGEKEV